MPVLKGKSISAELRDYQTGKLLSIGYNTLPTKDNELNKIIDRSYTPPEVHAEVNAIRSLPKNTDPQGLILILKGLPYCCTNCKDFIYQSKIGYAKTPGGGLVSVKDWRRGNWFLEEWRQ